MPRLSETTTLFEYKGWVVRNQGFFSFSVNSINAKHVECGDWDKVTPSWFHADIPVCSWCGVAVPDEIQGVLMMLVADAPHLTKEYQT